MCIIKAHRRISLSHHLSKGCHNNNPMPLLLCSFIDEFPSRAQGTRRKLSYCTSPPSLCWRACFYFFCSSVHSFLPSLVLFSRLNSCVHKHVLDTSPLKTLLALLIGLSTGFHKWVMDFLLGICVCSIKIFVSTPNLRNMIPFLHSLVAIIDNNYTPYKFGFRKPKSWGRM